MELENGAQLFGQSLRCLKIFSSRMSPVKKTTALFDERCWTSSIDIVPMSLIVLNGVGTNPDS